MVMFGKYKIQSSAAILCIALAKEKYSHRSINKRSVS